MHSVRGMALPRKKWGAIFGLILMAFLACSPFLFAQQTQPQQQTMPPMDDMPGMDMSQSMAPETPAQAAKRAADKRESEFNHHLAGALVIIAGFFLLMQDRLSKRWPGVKYIWASCFLLGGIYLALFSDTELWPVGHLPYWATLAANQEDVQHKIYAIILLVLGVIELLRASGKLKAAWSAWVFPVLGVAGAVMLLFHHHRAGMHGANHMQVMHQIMGEHRAFAAVGGGVALTNGLASLNTPLQKAFKILWPALMIVLGILLMLYTE